ncbi:ferredoxin [Pyrodictium delaneyi]|uniref:Ferredoxin n=1 Tax=Pyrodictium delaneyi TaxID=1273541 RepID=A0A211YS11_9CREN|nr:ferredoxin [Pyrodictium delaneyi]
MLGWRKILPNGKNDNAVEIVCTGGLVSEKCTRRVEVQLSETSNVINLIENIWADEPSKPILLVVTAFSGFGKLIKEISESGSNPFLIEATGIPETMLSGLPLDTVIEYWAGMLTATLTERKGAKRRSPRVSRREVLRRLFLIPPKYVMLPRLRSVAVNCRRDDVCPFSALEAGRFDEDKCQGCMLCAWTCPEAVEAPLWTGPLGLLYAYRFIDKYGLDGILFICHHKLEQLDKSAVEASPARLLAFHVPCVSWLSPRLLESLVSLGIYVQVYADKNVCEECGLKPAGFKAIDMLRVNGVHVSENLAEAGAAALTGYIRPKKSLEEVIELMTKSLYSATSSESATNRISS